MRFIEARIRKLLTSYSIGELDFESLEDLVIPLAWEQDGPARDVVDQVAAEIALVKDGTSDEAMFRERIWEIVATSATPARNE